MYTSHQKFAIMCPTVITFGTPRIPYNVANVNYVIDLYLCNIPLLLCSLGERREEFRMVFMGVQNLEATNFM